MICSLDFPMFDDMKCKLLNKMLDVHEIKGLCFGRYNSSRDVQLNQISHFI